MHLHANTVNWHALLLEIADKFILAVWYCPRSFIAVFVVKQQRAGICFMRPTECEFDIFGAQRA